MPNHAHNFSTKQTLDWVYAHVNYPTSNRVAITYLALSSKIQNSFRSIILPVTPFTQKKNGKRKIKNPSPISYTEFIFANYPPQTTCNSQPAFIPQLNNPPSANRKTKTPRRKRDRRCEKAAQRSRADNPTNLFHFLLLALGMYSAASRTLRLAPAFCKRATRDEMIPVKFGGGGGPFLIRLWRDDEIRRRSDAVQEGGAYALARCMRNGDCRARARGLVLRRKVFALYARGLIN